MEKKMIEITWWFKANCGCRNEDTFEVEETLYEYEKVEQMAKEFVFDKINWGWYVGYPDKG